MINPLPVPPITYPSNPDAGLQDVKPLMRSAIIEFRNTGCFRGVSLPTARERSFRVRRGCVPTVPRPGRWALVQVWDGAVLAWPHNGLQASAHPPP